jgi:hypothetical protein
VIGHPGAVLVGVLPSARLDLAAFRPPVEGSSRDGTAELGDYAKLDPSLSYRRRCVIDVYVTQSTDRRLVWITWAWLVVILEAVGQAPTLTCSLPRRTSRRSN